MDENLILNEIRAQNKASFKRFFNHFYEELVIYANSYLFDKHASEDVVQDVFLYVWENAEAIQIEKSLKGYLYKMVRNRCLNYLKSLKITDNSNFIELSINLVSDYNLDASDSDERIIIYNQVMQIIETLPSKMQQIFRLKFLSDYKYSEIADELGISENTVKTQLKRARKKINQSILLLIILSSIL